MRRLFFVLLALTITVSAGFSSSCSKKEPANEPSLKSPAAPPEHSKIIDNIKKSAEESKKVIVAKINGSDITMNDLIRRMNMIAPRFIQPGQERTPELDEKVKKAALDQLIFEELAVQEAKSQGMKASPDEVEEVLERIKTNLGSEDNYRVYLVKMGLNEDELKNEIARGRLFEMITKNEIYDKVQMNKDRVREIYEKEKGRFVKPAVLSVEDVFFTGSKDDPAAMEKAKSVLSTIKKNNNNLSGLVQDEAYVVRKGIIDKNEYPNIYSAAYKLKAGEVSGVIKEDDGLHIVKVEQNEPARQMTPDEANLAIHRELMASEAGKRQQAWEKELRQKAKIEILLDKIKKEDIVPVS
jgi:peptidyl-prolyl cis-trans isomerase C